MQVSNPKQRPPTATLKTQQTHHSSTWSICSEPELNISQCILEKLDYTVLLNDVRSMHISGATGVPGVPRGVGPEQIALDLIPDLLYVLYAPHSCVKSSLYISHKKATWQ